MSAFALKLTALVLMTLDHVQEFVPGMPIWLRWLGRGAAVIFFFCLAESVVHTHDRRAYCKRLYFMSAGMAVLDILIPFLLDCCGIGGTHPLIRNNIFGSLFFSAVLLSILEETKDDKLKRKRWLRNFILYQIGAELIVIVLSIFGPGWMETLAPAVLGMPTEGPLLLTMQTLLFYLCREDKKKLAVAYPIYCLCYGALFVSEITQRICRHLMPQLGDTGAQIAVLPLILLGCEPIFRAGSLRDSLLHTNFQWMMIFTLPLLLCYNGKRGKPVKKLFYVYYPLHIVVLYLISCILSGG